MGTVNSFLLMKKTSKRGKWDAKGSNIIHIQELLEEELSIPMDVVIAHFTPSNFPLVPAINKMKVSLCKESWMKIMDKVSSSNQNGSSISGISLFYNEFYERLELFDSHGKFEAVLSRHAKSDNKAEAKGAILIRIVNFLLSLEEDNEATQTRLYMLGKSHVQKQIRPWQYAIFVQTLLITIASRLESDATHDVMESWVHLLAFVLQSMLPAAIKGQVVETELYVNTSSEFANGKVADEVREMEETKELRKKFLKRTASDGGSSVDGSSPSNLEWKPFTHMSSFKKPGLSARSEGDGMKVVEISHEIEMNRRLLQEK